jgi:hypothetical protein
MNPSRLPDKLELAVGVNPEDGTIIDIGPYGHRVDWVEGGPSSVFYCNKCGSPFHTIGRLLKKYDEQQRLAEICGGCKEFLGFSLHQKKNGPPQPNPA